MKVVSLFSYNQSITIGGFNFGSITSSTTSSTTTASSEVFSGFAFGNKASTPAASSEQKSSVFSSFSFGVPSPKSQEVKTEEGSSAGVDLSASKNLTSFADLVMTMIRITLIGG
jgi:hypothetical protein